MHQPAHASETTAGSPWSLFDFVGSGIAVTSSEGTIEYSNAALLQLLGQHAGALEGSSIFTLLDGGPNRELEHLHRTALAANNEVRTQVRSFCGRFAAAAALRRFDADDGRRVIWSFVDARRNEPAPELALWGTKIGLWDWDVVNDRLTWINDWCEHSQLTAFSGYGHEQLWSSRIHPEDLSAYRQAVTRHLDGQTPPYDVEYRLRNRDDAWVWIQERGRVIERDSSGRAAGKALRIVGACIDVDSRRRAEQTLRTQAVILETMREGVALVTAEGRVEFSNPAFDRMFGRTSSEMSAISLLDLFDSRQVQPPGAYLEGLFGLRSRAGKRDMLFRRRDGSQFAGEVLSAEMELSGEKRILVVVQDVSERKQLESEIIEIANRERRRLGADLHDGLGQELTGISLMLRSLVKRRAVAAFDEAPELNEIITLVNHAIQSSRKMALGISPVTLERGGLLPALQTLIAWSRDNYNIGVTLRLSVRSPLLMVESAAAHLYLIVQEAINNAVRHGRARSILVTLRTNRMFVSVSISDDGDGIADSPARGAGMGLKLMQYRAAVIGGFMRIKRLGEGGTRIHIVCPQVAGPAHQAAPGQESQRTRP